MKLVFVLSRISAMKNNISVVLARQDCSRQTSCAQNMCWGSM